MAEAISYARQGRREPAATTNGRRRLRENFSRRLQFDMPRLGMSTPSHAPRWRDWQDTRNEQVPFDEYHQAVEAVMGRLLADVGSNGRRWSDLVRLLGDLPRATVVEKLESMTPEAFSEEDRTTFWSA